MAPIITHLARGSNSYHFVFSIHFQSICLTASRLLEGESRKIVECHEDDRFRLAGVPLTNQEFLLSKNHQDIDIACRTRSFKFCKMNIFIHRTYEFWAFFFPVGSYLSQHCVAFLIHLSTPLFPVPPTNW